MADILVVEDSRMISSFLKNRLTGLGYRVDAVRSMAESRLLLASSSRSYFLSILDLNLPDAQNGEVVDLMLENDIPSIVLTATMSSGLRDRLMRKGVIDYVLKSKDCVTQLLDMVTGLEINAGRSVLVVDDSDFLRHLIRDYLRLHGYRVLEAVNGKEALKMVEAHPEIRLVVTDYEMPGMDGFELCRLLRARYSRTELAIMGISSHKDDMLSTRFIKNGANDFLAKPFQREELYCRVAQNLDMLSHIEDISRLNARMTRDMEAAASLQKSLLPGPLEIPGKFTVAAHFQPCEHLAGDAYSYFVHGGQLHFYVVDVSGHGVPSALLSFTLSHLLAPPVSGATPLFRKTEQGFVPRDPDEVLTRLNEQFPMNPESFQYFTMVYGIYDPGSGRLTYASAGHPQPVAAMRDHDEGIVGVCGLAIGFASDSCYQSVTVDLDPGDRVLFFTDGVPEARDAGRQMFGEERLEHAFRKRWNMPLAPMLGEIVNDVAIFNKGRWADDVTLLAIERSG